MLSTVHELAPESRSCKMHWYLISNMDEYSWRIIHDFPGKGIPGGFLLLILLQNRNQASARVDFRSIWQRESSRANHTNDKEEKGMYSTACRAQ